MSAPPVDVAVIGGGMVGLSTAVEALSRGLSVVLIDAGGPRDKASHGNAGVIGRGSLLTVASPGVRRQFWRYALNRHPGLRIDYTALAHLAPWLRRFLARCDEARWREGAASLDPLVARALDRHAALAARVGASTLIRQAGFLKVYRTQAAYHAASLEREIVGAHGVRQVELDAAGLHELEPALKPRFVRATFHPDSATIVDPAALLDAYRAFIVARGGVIVPARVETIVVAPDGVVLRWPGGEARARQGVIAAGAASRDLAAGLGCRLPLIAERGYHREFTRLPGLALGRAVADVEGNYVLAPRGGCIRLLSGIELARAEAPPSPRQITALEPEARASLDFGAPLEDRPWLGARPSLPDGLPAIGRAPGHARIIFAFGHGHIGMSTGPATAEAVADLLTDRAPAFGLAAFSPARFG